MNLRCVMLIAGLCLAVCLCGSGGVEGSSTFDPMVVWNAPPSTQETTINVEMSQLYRRLESVECDMRFAREKLKLYSGPPIAGLKLTAEDWKRDEKAVKDLEQTIERLKREIREKERELEAVEAKPESDMPEEQTGQEDAAEEVADPVDEDETAEEAGEEVEEQKSGVAHISYLYGLVEVRRAGTDEWAPVSLMQELQPGDVVRTKRRSKVEMRFGDRIMVSLQPNSQMEIPTEFKVKEDTLLSKTIENLKLFFGFIYVNGRKLDGELNVQTPRAICGVRGTTFSVDVKQDGTTRVVVLDGTVEVQPRGATSGAAVVTKNMVCLVDPDGKAQVSALSAEEQAREVAIYETAAGQDEQKLVEQFQRVEVGDLTVEQQIAQYQAFLHHPDVDEATDLITQFMRWAESITGAEGRITLLALMQNRRALQEHARGFPEALENVSAAPAAGAAAEDMKRVWVQTLADYIDATRLLDAAAARLDSRAFHRGGELFGQANAAFIGFSAEIGEKMKSVRR